MTVASSHDETTRLRALHGYEILDTTADADFDRFVRLAARQLRAPMAALTFVDRNRVWFKAQSGMAMPEADRTLAFCNTTILHDEVCLVDDAHTDPRFADSDVVRAAPELRFYAGAPLITPGGFRIGALCVFDTAPRRDFDDEHVAILTDLASLVVTQLELRRERIRHERSVRDLAVINDILTLLVDTRTLREAVEQTIARVTQVTGALMGSLLELRRDDGMVHLVTLQVRAGVARAGFEQAHLALPQPPERISQSELFGDSPGPTIRVQRVVPRAEHPVLERLHALGVAAIAALSLPVGRQRHVLVLGFDEAGTDFEAVEGLLAQLRQALRPVLQRKLAEESVTLLEAALSVTHDAVLITEAEPIDQPGPRIVYVNDGFTRMTGWTRDEVIGQTPRLLQTPQTDRAELDKVRAALQAWQPVRVELLNRCRDGTPIWIELEISPLADSNGWFTHWVAVQRDITERRAREREAMETARRLTELADDLITAQRIARLGTWHWNPRDRRLQWSAETYAMFGVTPEHFTPSLEAALALVHPEDRAETKRRLEEMMLDGTAIAFDFRTLGPDGVVRHCHCEGVRALDAGGATLQATGFCQDVTERRHAEAMLLQTEKLNALGQLTGGLAHDFNNLLTVISLNLEIATDMIGADHPVREMLDPAMKAAASGAVLTSSLLSFARRQPMLPSPTDMNRLIPEIVALATRAVGERHPVRLELQPDLKLCLIDQAQFESAIINLLVNSRDAMPQGGEIVIRTGMARVDPDEAPRRLDLAPGDYVTVSVVDSGAGIPPALQQRVFEPFFTTKPMGKGTGLGLSMVMGFARQSGGQIALDSSETSGTTISLYLPASSAELIAL